MSHSTLALLTVPIVTGAIGYVTNWTGVLMLFYPVRFRGWRVPGAQTVVRLLPHKIQQIPGVMLGGIGWQGIVPSRAAKMGSLAVDSGIAKIGRPREFFNQLEPDKIAEQIIVSARQDLPGVVDGIMVREQPRLWQELPGEIKEMIEGRVLAQLPEVVHELTGEIGEHIEQLVDIKLMVIKRFDPELANRVFLDMGQRELTFIKNFGFVFGFALGIPVAVLTHFVTAWWLLPILGVVIGYVTNWVALWMIYEPAEPRHWGPLRVHGLFIRRQHDVAEVYATIVADEILTVSEFGSELLHGPQSDRTRALVEDALRPAIDRAVGPARRAVQVALGGRQYASIREAFATEPIDQMMEPLTDPTFSREQSATMRKLITERIRQMAPTDFAELLRTATREDEWLLLVHGAVLGLAGGLIHLAVFGERRGGAPVMLDHEPPLEGVVVNDGEPRHYDYNGQPSLEAQLLRNAPALARAGAGMWWQAARWGVARSVRAGGRLARAAADPARAAQLLDEVGRELRGYARDLLGITELDERVARLMPPPEPDEDGAASVSEREALRIRGAQLLRDAARIEPDDRAHPAYARILTELAPDEGRILRLLATEGPQPAVDVRTASFIGVGSELVTGGMNMIGAQAGCQHRERVPAYLNNLERLGLIWFSREPVADPVAYQVLEAQPEVLEAMRSVNRAKTVQRSIHLTPFGEDFCTVCLPLDPVETEALSVPEE